MTSLANRLVTPEILDALSPTAPEAQASRRDLRRINALMLQSRILARLMGDHVDQPPHHILELGCGDGHLTLNLVRRLAPIWPGVHLTLLDAQPVVLDSILGEIVKLGWTVEVQPRDVFDWLSESPRQDLVYCNLFLHHFEDEALASLLTAIDAMSRICVAAEPRRGAVARFAARSLGIIRANAVTRHDADVSVQAGFRADELGAIWPGTVHVDRSFGPFSHGFAGASRD